MDVRCNDDLDQLATAAAATVADALRAALRHRRVATLAVSGGSSPVRLFTALAAEDLDWSSVHVFQVDERLVPGDHEARNWAMQYRLLVEPTGAHGHPLTIAPGAPSAAASLLRANDEAILRRFAGTPPVLDVVHLGLGADGHTASWSPERPFPDSVATPALTAVADFNGYDRLTLTPSVVNAAGLIIWFVPASGKQEMIHRLVAGDRAIPAGLVRRERAVLFTDIDLDEQNRR